MNVRWLSHHHPDDEERCISIASVALCRRCTALWPICFLTIAISLQMQWRVAHWWELLGLLLLPVLEFCAVHLGQMTYRASRVWLLGTLAGVGAGRLFHRYLLEPSDPVVWTLMLGLGLPAVIAAAYHEIGKNPNVE